MKHLHRAGRGGRPDYLRKSSAELSAEAQRRSIEPEILGLATELSKSRTGFEFNYKYPYDDEVFDFACLPLRLWINITEGGKLATTTSRDSGIMKMEIGRLLLRNPEATVRLIFFKLGYIWDGERFRKQQS